MNAELPKDAKRNGVRIRWWQPHHSGQSLGDWAIDDIVVGGNAINPSEVKDDFNAGRRESVWLQSSNSRLGDYCGSESAVVGEAIDKENVVLTTTDVAVLDDYILQFGISVGCNASWESDLAPVHLQYSTDYGMTWRHLVHECLPYHPECNGFADTWSVYYASAGWRRITIPLRGPAIST